MRIGAGVAAIARTPQVLHFFLEAREPARGFGMGRSVGATAATIIGSIAVGRAGGLLRPKVDGIAHASSTWGETAAYVP